MHRDVGYQRRAVDRWPSADVTSRTPSPASGNIGGGSGLLLESVGWEGAADVSDLWRYDAILAFITAGAVIDRILAHLRRTRGDHRAALTCAPRACRRNGRDARAPVQVPVLR